VLHIHWFLPRHLTDSLHPLLSISAHPSVEFLVIINPNSGPGDGSRPGHDYEREVPRLTSKPNVTTIGYVRVDYCKKPLHDACEEIDRFAGWVTKHGSDVPGLSVDGIYVDETPNHFSAGRKLYLEALHKHVKGKDGLLGQRLVSLSGPICCWLCHRRPYLPVSLSVLLLVNSPAASRTSD